MSNQYYIKRGDKVRGPVSETRLNELLAEGKLREPDLVSLRNDGGWKPIGKILKEEPNSTRTAPPRASKASSQMPPEKTSRPRIVWILSSVAALVVSAVVAWLLYSRTAENSGVAVVNPPQNEQRSEPSEAVPASPPSAPVVNFQFTAPQGAAVGWLSDRKFFRQQLTIPGNAEFTPGTTVQLSVDNLPGDAMKGVSFYPTLEFPETTAEVKSVVSNLPLELQLAEAEFNSVKAGELFTKVWYLANRATDAETTSVKPTTPEVLTLSSIENRQSTDPVAEAKERGTIVAILRMGNRSRSFEEPSVGESQSPTTMEAATFVPPISVVSTETNTVQFQFGGQPAVGIGWVADETLQRNQRFTPGRADFEVGITRLICDSIPVDVWKGKSLYPTLELKEFTPRTQTFLSHCCVLLELTEQDYQKAASGGTVTKVLYLEGAAKSGGNASTSPSAFSKLVTLDLDKPDAPFGINEQQTAVVVVFRMSNEQIGEDGTLVAAAPDAAQLPTPGHQDAEISPPYPELQKVLTRIGGRQFRFSDDSQEIQIYVPQFTLPLTEDSKLAPDVAEKHYMSLLDEFLRLLSHIDRRFRLTFSNRRGYPKSTLLTLAKLSSLDALNFTPASLEAFDDECCLSLADLPKLRFLSIGGPKVTDTGVIALGKIETLVSLELSDARITARGIAALAAMPNLKSLTLSGDAINDDTMKSLRGHPRLESLRLENCKRVTSQSIATLKSIAGVVKLGLHKTGISGNSLSEWRRERPDLIVDVSTTDIERFLVEMLDQPVKSLAFPGDNSLGDPIRQIPLHFNSVYGAARDIKMQIVGDAKSLKKVGFKSIDEFRITDINLDNIPLRDALRILLDNVKDVKLDYEIRDDKIVITAEKR